MGGKSVLIVLTVAQILHLSAAVFFHEPSSVLITPLVHKEHSDFGFSMSYRIAQNILVVGAPSVDFLGKVYSCELNNAGYVKEINCYENLIDFESLAEYSRSVNPNQYFYTGASIAATSDYIFTCAPLWTSDVKTLSGIKSDAFGTCFVLNETDTYRYVGTLERYLKHRFTSNLRSFIGGTGWSTLVDEENDLLLIVKTSLDGDFVYTSMSNPLKPTKSMVLATDRASRTMAMYLREHWNIGYGITAGKFFSNSKTVYAFSMEMKGMGGAISFLEYNPKRNFLSIMNKNKAPYKLESKVIGTMFGSTMAAADFNMDGKEELLVGAPAQTEEDCIECGALHIYLGGDMETIDDRNRLRLILGSKDFGRFSSAIATRDIDGDSIPELVVSAPYEDDGIGAVYVLSGYEVYHTLIKFQTFRHIQVSDLKLTQKIKKESFRILGFSLQFLADADDNGCSELAVGSPGNGRVLLFKCVQTINVTVSSEIIGEQTVREQDKNFTVKVCTRVELHDLPYDIAGNISVTSSIIGEATYIPEPQFIIDISCYNCSRNRLFCENVTVLLNNNDPGDYMFTSKAELNTEHIFNSKELNSSWVVTSPYSQLVKSIEVSRHCKGDDCIPKLSVEVLWSGRDEYVLGSTSNETVTIRVRNDGNASYESCVWVRVIGAPLARVDCAGSDGGYRCYLPKPLRRNTEHSIQLVLNMTRLTNLEKELQVEMLLFENCNQRNVISGKAHLIIPYIFTTDNIYVVGTSHNRNVTDKQILDSEYIYENQEYQIINNGSLTWKLVHAIITMKEKPFIHSFEVSMTDSGKCEKENAKGSTSYTCILDLTPNSRQKVITTTEILGSEIVNNLYEEKLNMTSHMVLYLQPSAVTKYANSTTVMEFKKEFSFGNNKWYIALLAILLAIIVLAIIIFILYKVGFFRRKQKQRLQVLRKESIRQQNSRRTTHASDAKDENLEGLQMDVDDDCPFDDVTIPETTNDNVVLVENKAQVHC